MEQLGYIQFENSSSTVPCRVRNLDGQGAVLTMDGWLGMPASFTLSIDSGRERFNCKVLNHRGNSAKVAFA